MRDVVLFAKAPIAGRVKTRLARDIGVIAAAFWYRRTLAATLRMLGRARLHAEISASPSAPVFRSTFRARAARISNQPVGDLGRRMSAAIKRARGPSIIVGGDIPGLSDAILLSACDAVRRYDVVFGPASDGGFYLVGLRSAAHAFRLYEGVRWSSSHALADTLRNTPKHWHVGFMPLLRDVDCEEDLYPTTSKGKQISSARVARLR